MPIKTLLCILLLVVAGQSVAAPSETPREVTGSAQITLDENTFFVANFITEDDVNGSLTLSLEGEDSGLFQLQAGELSFITAPNYEQPDDQSHNNIYTLRVNARDEAGFPSAIDLQIIVNNINEAPVFAIESQYTVVENQPFVLLLHAVDDEGDTFTFSIAGDDGNLFELTNSTTLSLSQQADFEQPQDSNSDNQYQVDITATDSNGNASEFLLTVVVEDRPELGYFNQVSEITVFESEASNGLLAPLFDSIEWLEPDERYTDQVLNIYGHLNEDNITLTEELDAGLVWNRGSGQIWSGDDVVASVDLNLNGEAGNTLQIHFNALTSVSQAQAIWQGISFSTNAIIPTDQRQLMIEITDQDNRVIRVIEQLTVIENEMLTPSFVISSGVNSHIADMDNDGQPDLILGKANGQLALHLSNSKFDGEDNTIFDWSSAHSGILTEFDVGDNAVPTTVDFDADGDLDLFVGNASGFISYFENTSTGSSLQFTNRIGRQNPVSRIDVGGEASPLFFDVDDDGDKDLLVTNNQGQVFFYLNVGNVAKSQFELVESGLLNGDLSGDRLRANVADFDLDGDLDLIVGTDQGQLHYFENVGSAGLPDLQENSNGEPFSGFSSTGLLTPHFWDLDNDRDVDLFIQSDDAQFQVLENQSGLTLFVVKRENTAPVIEASNAVEIVGNVQYALTANASDLDGDPLTYKWRQTAGQDAIILNDESANLTFVSPQVTEIQVLLFEVEVFDGRTSTTAEFQVNVYPIGTNIPGYNVPQIVLAERLTTMPGEKVWLSAGMSDADHDDLTFTWLQASGPSVELIGSDTLVPTFIAPQTGATLEIVFRLVVTDGLFTEFKDVTIVVEVATVESEEEDKKGFSSLVALSFSYLQSLAMLVMVLYRRKLQKT